MESGIQLNSKYEKQIQLYFYLFSLLGIVGNSLDLLAIKSDWDSVIYIFNFITILLLITNSILFYFHIYRMKLAFSFTLYIILVNIILSNYTNLFTNPDSTIILLRESLFVCFLITAAYLFIDEKNGIIAGSLFISYFVYTAFRSNSDFLISNLPNIVILYSAYILILSFFYRLQRRQLIQIKEDNRIINAQNDELTTINNEYKETQRQLSVQHEELLTLSESVSSQNAILEKQNNELEKTVQQKNKLFSIIAHDIKSPLYSISSLTEIIINKFENLNDEKKKMYLSKMLESNKHLQSLLENLLTWSRSQSGLVDMNPEQINIRELVTNIISIYKNNASNKSIKFIVEVDEIVSLTADRRMLETVFRNLISNALKYSFENGEIKVKANDQNGNVQFIVKDTGMGVSEDKLSKLFTYSNDIISLGTKGEKGTGLGLSICKEFIEKHSGNIWIESKEKLGTSIHFSLPKKFVTHKKTIV